MKSLIFKKKVKISGSSSSSSKPFCPNYIVVSKMNYIFSGPSIKDIKCSSAPKSSIGASNALQIKMEKAQERLK